MIFWLIGLSKIALSMLSIGIGIAMNDGLRLLCEGSSMPTDVVRQFVYVKGCVSVWVCSPDGACFCGADGDYGVKFHGIFIGPALV